MLVVVILMFVIVGVVIVIIIYKIDMINMVILVIDLIIFSDFIFWEVIYIKKINNVSVSFCKVMMVYFFINELLFFKVYFNVMSIVCGFCVR